MVTGLAASEEPGRYVPLQIQEKAIRYGTRMPAPLRKPGLFRYQTRMYKLVENKQKSSYFYKPYRLEVLV